MIDIIVFIKKIKGERQIKLNNYRTLKKHSSPRKEGSCLLWVVSTEISVDIAVDTRSIIGRQSVDTRSTVG